MIKENRINYIKKTKFEDSTQLVLCLLGVTIWTSLYSKNQSWFRLFGRGFMWKHQDKGLRFSQRYGYTKYFKLGKWFIEYLPYRKNLIYAEKKEVKSK